MLSALPAVRISFPLLCALVLACGAVHAGVTTPFQLATNARNIIVWQEFHPWLMITEDLADGRTCYYLDHNNRSKMTFKPPSVGTWVPLGGAIKWLMYVDHYQNLDRLMAHDVDWHADYIAQRSVRNQIPCGMTGTQCVFGQYRAAMVGDHYPVDLYSYDVASGLCAPFCLSESGKSQFAHDGSLIVYRANLGGGDVRIYGIRFSGGSEFEIAPRNGTQPSVCGDLVAWAEASGSGSNIVAKDLSTGDIRTVAYTTASPPNPQAGRGAIFWQDARNASSTGLDIYGYDWATSQEFAVTTATGDQKGLRVCDDLVTWVTGVSGYQILWAAYYQPPVRIADLRPSLVTGSSVTLTWTSPGASVYDLRTRIDSPVTDANWAESTPVSGLPEPQAASQTESFTAQSLPVGTRYFAIKAGLSGGDWSLLSNCVRVFVSEQPACLGAEPGSCVSFAGVVTGIGADGAVYCQSPSAPVAVRAEPESGQSVSQGQTVTCTGVLAVDADLAGPVLGKCIITAQPDQGIVRPYAMANRSVGSTTPGGASNTWVLARTWGKVSGLSTLGEGSSFHLTDGDVHCGGIQVTSRFAPPAGLANGVFVAVQGIAGFSQSQGRRIEIVADDGITLYSE